MAQLRRLTRREMLSLLLSVPVAAIGSGAGAALRLASPNVARAEPLPPEIRAETVPLAVKDVAAEGITGAIVSGEDILAHEAVDTAFVQSRVVASPFPFQALGIRWQGSREVNLFVRSSAEGDQWTDWFELGEELVPLTGASRGYASTLYSPPDGTLHDRIQLRVKFGEGREIGASVSDLRLVFIDATGGRGTAIVDGTEKPTPVEPTADEWVPITALDPTQPAVIAAAVAKPAVVSRAGWGCPDPNGDMTDSNGFLLWPKEYYSVSHIVIHHTTNTNPAPGVTVDWKAVVRGLWRYHAIDLEWGDIGYNYLVDPNGTLYEGRAGGDDVIAGHTYTFNSGTMGLAFIGTFSTVQPSSAAVSSAQSLMAWKCDQKGFSPLDSGYLHHPCDGGQVYQKRIAGHRDYAGLVCSGYQDLNNTTCPGNALHAMLPSLRSGTDASLLRPKAELSGAGVGPALVAVGQLLSFTITVRNAGTGTMPSGSPGTGTVYQEGQVASGSPAGLYRLALDYSGRPNSQGAYPYRWGLGGDLAPGQSRTVTCSIQVNAESGPRVYWIGLILEGSGMVADHLVETTVYARVRAVSNADVCLGRVLITPSTVFTQSVLVIQAEVQNWGGSTPPTQSPNPGYTYLEGQTCPDDVYGAYRFAVDYDGRTQTKDHPYRWGIGQVPPLSVRSVNGFIRMPTAKSSRRFWVGLVKEGVTWTQDSLGTKSVIVQEPKSRLRLPFIRR